MSSLPPLILLDGGLGTTLADQHGVVFDDSTPLWSSSTLLTPCGREVLSKVQTEFAREGADVLLSATYQLSYGGWARSVVDGVVVGGVKEDAARGMRGAVDAARAACATIESGAREEGTRGQVGKKVALGLGAYGATMIPGQEYSGKYDGEHDSIDKLREWHLERLSAFVPLPSQDFTGDEREEREQCWQSVDMVAFETLPRVDEILAVREVMGSLGKERGREFWVSCVFPGEGNCLPDGSSVREVVGAMLGEGKGERPWGVGLNCTKIGKVENLVQKFEEEVGALLREGSEWPALVLYPDGTNGEVYNTTTKVWEKKSGGNGSKVSSQLSIVEAQDPEAEANLP